MKSGEFHQLLGAPLETVEFGKVQLRTISRVINMLKIHARLAQAMLWMMLMAVAAKGSPIGIGAEKKGIRS